METTTPQFDAAKYKNTTRDQWQSAAEAWYRWSDTLHQWLGPATEKMLEMAGITTGQRVLDVAAGAGEQSITAAKRVGSSGYVLATDISSNILEYAQKMAEQAEVKNIETKVMDGENLTVHDENFDAVISRVGLIYFPDQQKALKEMLRVLKPGGKVAAIVYSTPDKNKFFSVPVSIIRTRAKLPPPLSGQPGPFSLGAEGVIEKAFLQAGFKNVQAERINSPLRLSSAAECVRFEKESFGALHQMLSGLPDAEKESVWEEIEMELKQFESERGFEGPCEMIVAVGEKI
ncbi:class I SAM-dependent methyltransferase [Segetibacter aerophilus]|uniref:Methyltransferase n=1 Tax=Segetibacter aerophilus TaxID=670293 RepID=A0A512BHK7_9BACT|nr:class I SAM-dependent methyltransferase [Segetibacter aerophilus]GEO11440.1 methyltransferase [Segetibacter aerophilus]